MDNLMLNQEQNWTMSSCSEPYYTISVVVTNILLFSALPTTTLVLMKLLTRLYKTRSFLPAEVFLLQINFANMFLFVSYLLLFLDALHVGQFYVIIFLFLYIPSLTARPVFVLSICVICYLAIVHPVTYMATKSLRHWEWLVTTLIWFYALAMDVAIIIYKIDTSQLVIMLFHIIILSILFFCVTMLRALFSSGRGNGRQTLNPAKRKASRLILSTLLLMLVYYLPQAYFFTYHFVAPADLHRFQCSEGLVIMTLSKFSDLASPVISLYSLGELGA